MLALAPLLALTLLAPTAPVYGAPISLSSIGDSIKSGLSSVGTSITNGVSSVLGGEDSTEANADTGTPTPFSEQQINDTLVRPALFARVAYCKTENIEAWDCGEPCKALTNITFLQAGGDQAAIPLYYIAHDADAQQLVVAHEGTDPAKLLSILNDAQFGLVPLNASRFPTAGDGVTVHDGFQQTFERTADGLLAGVQKGLADTGVKKILVTGHSLGAALASMTGLMIKNAVDPSVDVTVTTFGMPRGGNTNWANLLDQTSPVTFVTNQDDPVPSVPPKFLGFQHTQGEIHVTDADTNTAVDCPGQDNVNCITGNSVLQSSTGILNHLGPYFNGLSFGGQECTPIALF
ncbi:alpha/beta-hydrolase [Roridomyces roridus]|uniref:Alpha/beta-hydrolase n=1 Tax=Roridomyces roridus TaxID=1738132 RepID=A0AAD7BBS0_9AGAR|nr:alpha/beta-hydrolase [Roridomyces roridus]